VQPFFYIKNDNLPRLAWCARLSTRSNEVVVEHGPWVEPRKVCFYAAAWSGSLDEARPDEAVTCCGTGAVEVLASKDQFRPATWVDIETFIIDHSRNHQTRVKTPERYLYHWGFYRTRERYDRALGK
jgi:hypothetical protein